MSEDPRLRRLSDICASLPESERELSGRHAGFRVRKRTFAYYLDDHHGDGMVGVVFKAPGGQSAALVQANADHMYMPAYLGSRGWAAIRLDQPTTDWIEVEDLVTESYRQIAPKRLAAQLDPLT